MSDLIKLLEEWGYINAKSNDSNKNQTNPQPHAKHKNKNKKISASDKRCPALQKQLIKEGRTKPVENRDSAHSIINSARIVPHVDPKKVQQQQKYFNKIKSSKRKPPSVVCVLCGKKVEGGQMLEHKRVVHKEETYQSSFSSSSSEKNMRAHFVQGGLPSLGKRSK